MYFLKLHIKNLLKMALIMMLIFWQFLSVSLFYRYGVIEQYERNGYEQTIRINNEVHSETLFTIKDFKWEQNLFPYLDKHKYKHDSKYNLHQVELLLIGCLIEKKESHFQEVEIGNLNPRSPPQCITNL